MRSSSDKKKLIFTRVKNLYTIVCYYYVILVSIILHVTYGVEWNCAASTNAGTFTRSSDCAISGTGNTNDQGGGVDVTGTLEITGSSTDMQNLVTAYLFGAKVIEKHFTLNKKKKGNDHYHSLDKTDLINFRKKIKSISITLGFDKKKFLNTELKSRKNARRSIVINRYIKKGSKITEKDLICKRPATGISPMQIKKVIGRKVKRNLKSDTILNWSYLKK